MDRNLRKVTPGRRRTQTEALHPGKASSGGDTL